MEQQTTQALAPPNFLMQDLFLCLPFEKEIILRPSRNIILTRDNVIKAVFQSIKLLFYQI